MILASETIIITPRHHHETEIVVDAHDKDHDDEKKRYSSSFYRSTASMKTGQQDLGSVDVVLTGVHPDHQQTSDTRHTSR